LLGALLDELSAVLGRLPHVQLDHLPRMADFAQILAALDLANAPCSATADTILLSDPSPNLALTSSSNSSSADAADAPDAPDAADAADASSLEIYLSQNKRLASEVIDGDAVAIALAQFMQSRQTWLGTATELLSVLSPPETSRTWPKSAQPLTARLKRLSPALRTIGINIDYQRDTDKLRTRRIHLTATPAK